MAIPGETDCRPLAPCGDPPWGDIPLEPGAQHVDRSYQVGDSDGSADKPWPSLQLAITAASAGDMIAIAAGDYEETVFFTKSVRIWGRCPELVSLNVPPLEVLMFHDDGTELHTVAVTADGPGLVVDGARDVWLDRVWIHDTGDAGVVIIDAAEVVVSGSLVERAGAVGLVVLGSALELSETVVRSSRYISGVGAGRGVDVEYYSADELPASLLMHRSVLEGNREVGLAIFGAQAELTDSVVRGTLSRDSDQRFGFGIAIQDSSDGQLPADVGLERVVLEDSHTGGITTISSTARMHRVTVRDTAAQVSDDAFGDGLSLLHANSPAEVTLEESLVAGSARAAIANFSGHIGLGAVDISCNLIDLAGENVTVGYLFEELAPNSCHCGEESRTCKALSTGLAPPQGL